MPKLTEEQLTAKLHANPVYQNLTQNQKEFVRLYVTHNGDMVPTGFSMHRVYRYQRDPKIVALLGELGFATLRPTAVNNKEILRLASARLRSANTSNDEFLRLVELVQGIQPERKSRKQSVPSTIDEAVLAAEKAK